MKHTADYIKIYKGALSVKFCEALIGKAGLKEADWLEAKAVKDRDRYRSAKFFNGINRTYKTKKGKTFNFDSILFKVVVNLVVLYQKTFRSLNIKSDEGYQLLRYCVGDFHTEHVDDCIEEARKLSIIFMCNDNFKGGDLKFMGDHVIRMGVGDAIVFPSNFAFPHQVTPVTEGVRYSISSFCR